MILFIGLSSDGNWKLCAREMFQYCKDNNLAETWAYLYNRWYTWQYWRLWARSARVDAIPAGRTTMLVEAHWRVMKHDYLHRFHRARLDMLVWIIVTRVLKGVVRKFDDDVIERCTPLHWERKFVAAWKKHCKNPDNGPSIDYHTDLNTWTCRCPDYVSGPFLLCKHLVRLTGNLRLPIRQYIILRRSTSPFIALLKVIFNEEL